MWNTTIESIHMSKLEQQSAEITRIALDPNNRFKKMTQKNRSNHVGNFPRVSIFLSLSYHIQ